MRKSNKNDKQVKENKFKKFWEEWSIFPKWTIRKICFVGILIAISVVFLVIATSLVPVASIPTYKISFIGLPIKISGFIFGPLIGGIVGLISDLLSFLFVPSFYNPLYTLATMVDGIIAGLIGFLFVKLFRYYFGGEFQDNVYESKIWKLSKQIDKLKLNLSNEKKIIKLENKIILAQEKRKSIRINGTANILLNINLFVALVLLALFSLFIFWLVAFVIPENIIKKGVIPNKWGLLATMLSGYTLMFFFIIIARFKMKPSNYLVIVPIIIFSALIELINVPLLSFADQQSLQKPGESNIFVFVFNHILFSPVKIWFNMFIIYFTYNIIAPLINKNNNIAY
ncbi:ECF transporter S component [Mycoplasmopsis caviae]|uniref:ECF transporter S component n=1 Tax=Mycoplasmopsis caviae TaxID=55603 RepID=A0A3P8L7D5_9BACT|nr:ECF transporter S component [Mycoplasmopsis caviae]UUD35059.1 ECF transporter S component [Mycoplasmopsis caviae]VDR42115.1 Folate ECF transporter S component FolT [Mycoplasmopsis caviae]